MRFYDRKQEIAELQRLDQLSAQCAQFTVLIREFDISLTQGVVYFYQ
mgnify:CR=1 FL=1